MQFHMDFQESDLIFIWISIESWPVGVQFCRYSISLQESNLILIYIQVQQESWDQFSDSRLQPSTCDQISMSILAKVFKYKCRARFMGPWPWASKNIGLWGNFWILADSFNLLDAKKWKEKGRAVGGEIIDTASFCP